MVAYNPVEALQVNVIPHFKALEVFTIEVTSFFSCTADDYLPLDKRAVILRPSPFASYVAPAPYAHIYSAHFPFPGRLTSTLTNSTSLQPPVTTVLCVSGTSVKRRRAPWLQGPPTTPIGSGQYVTTHSTTNSSSPPVQMVS